MKKGEAKCPVSFGDFAVVAVVLAFVVAVTLAAVAGHSLVGDVPLVAFVSAIDFDAVY